MKLTWILAICSLILIAPNMVANAEERYSLGKTEDGTVRLDRKSGAISFCREINGGMTCSMAADERTAWQDEVEDMSARIDMLEKRIAHLEATSTTPTDQPEASKPEPKSSTPGNGDELTGKEERQVDKVMRVAEKMMRRMIGVVKELKRDIETN